MINVHRGLTPLTLKGLLKQNMANSFKVLIFVDAEVSSSKELVNILKRL